MKQDLTDIAQKASLSPLEGNSFRITCEAFETYEQNFDAALALLRSKTGYKGNITSEKQLGKTFNRIEFKDPSEGLRAEITYTLPDTPKIDTPKRYSGRKVRPSGSGPRSAIYEW